MFECRATYDVCAEIARHFGKEEEFTNGKTQEQWQEEAFAKMRESDPELPPTLADARKLGMAKRRMPDGKGVGLSKFRADPAAAPLKTPSGKIEIYSEGLAKIASTWTLPEGDVITPLPQYVSTWESSEDHETKKTYPLQLFGFHMKGRTHSTYHNVAALRRAVTDAVWINPIDAQARGIRDGDKVRVQSKRGALSIFAKVTPRIMPGVAAMGQGAWYAGGLEAEKDKNGKPVDSGGCVNMLTSHRPSPLAKGNPQHTNLVEIVKIA